MPLSSCVCAITLSLLSYVCVMSPLGINYVSLCLFPNTEVIILLKIVSCFIAWFQLELFFLSLLVTESSPTLTNDIIAILSHVARCSSEYVNLVTSILAGEEGKYFTLPLRARCMR